MIYTLAGLAAAYKAGPREDGRTLSPLMLDNDHVSAEIHDENWVNVDRAYEAHPEELLEQALDLLGIPHEHV